MVRVDGRDEAIGVHSGRCAAIAPRRSLGPARGYRATSPVPSSSCAVQGGIRSTTNNRPIQPLISAARTPDDGAVATGCAGLIYSRRYSPCFGNRHKGRSTGPFCIHLQTAAPLAVRGIDPNQGFASVLVTPPDGATLHVRSYGPRFTSALPVVCLPGLARTSADFHLLATALAADPARPRHVLALDYRGHGQSKYDRNPNNYALPVALGDLSAVLTELKIAPATFIGTSYGGLLAMMLALSRPAAIAGVILNDIGPVIEPEGLLRLKLRIEGLGGKLPIPRNFGEGAEILRWLLHAQFP